MEAESGVTRSFIDELHSWVIQGDEISGISGGTGIIIHDLHFSDTQREQM